jgi:hypothetical protein
MKILAKGGVFILEHVIYVMLSIFYTKFAYSKYF